LVDTHTHIGRKQRTWEKKRGFASFSFLLAEWKETEWEMDKERARETLTYGEEEGGFVSVLAQWGSKEYFWFSFL
jgi:hypothetical protein